MAKYTREHLLQRRDEISTLVGRKEGTWDFNPEASKEVVHLAMLWIAMGYGPPEKEPS